MKKEKLIEIRNGLKELIKKEMELKDQTKLIINQGLLRILKSSVACKLQSQKF